MRADEPRKITPSECAELLLKIERPLILCHVRPDGDTLGTAVALAEVFAALGKKAELACAHPVPERLGFITEGYSLAEDTDNRVAVAVDVASPGQLGALAERDIEVACVIDHHASSTPFAPHYTVGEASSAAEALYEVIEALMSRGLSVMNERVAKALYTAISSDTGCFCYSNSTPKAHMIAASLLAYGFDAADINHRLFHSHTKEQIVAESYVGSHLNTAFGGRVAYFTLTLDELNCLGLSPEHFETAVDVVRSLRGVEIAITAKEVNAGEFKLSLRSTGPAVSEVAAHFGGGGHLRAAGLTIRSDNIEDAISQVLDRVALLLTHQ
ncbi:MAG: bifunctional oligoribonuclease/PAP phosphatase NrnA [Clostridia bacterium]|nr:bifunctional oligoribonuclease/PAP phosphatase NrnA [Clostridia bacterium]